MAITIGATILLVVVFDKGPLGVLVGNFTGTLIVYAALLVYSRHALGLQFDRKLYRAMNRFGLPLVPSAVALWLTNFSDRFFLIKLCRRARGRPLLDRRANRLRDRPAADRVPDGVARVRLLDRGRS